MIDLDTTDLLRWARYLESMPAKLGPALARGLNAFGDEATQAMAKNLAAKYDLEAGAVMNLLVVRRASPGHLKYEVDGSAVAKTDPRWLRPWEERDQSAFEQDSLVKVVTLGDEFDCEVCEQVAENSPWTAREIAQNQGKWTQMFDGGGGTGRHRAGHGLVGTRTDLIHPNCRCVTRPWTSTRRMKMTFAESGAPPELLTVRQFGKRVADELKIAIRVVR
jgi:hypothetical protein